MTLFDTNRACLFLMIALGLIQPTLATSQPLNSLLSFNDYEYQSTLSPDSAMPFDRFGHAMDTDQDWLVVSAINQDNPEPQSGAVYLYQRQSGDWQFVQILTPSDTHPGQRFGTQVVLADGQLFVSAVRDQQLGQDAGAVYVYELNGDAWALVDKLLASDGAPGDRFGWDLGIGADQLLISADLDDHSGQLDAGAVYVFERAGNSWMQSDKLLALDGQATDRFGASLSVDGARLLVGADRAGAVAVDSGAAYLFRFQAEGWVQSNRLIASDGKAGDRFGFSVALDGATALIAAPRSDRNGTETGSVYVFHQIGEFWSEVELLFAESPVVGDRFGQSLMLDGELAVIGAFGVTSSGTTDGTASLFEIEGPQITGPRTLVPPQTGQAGGFGLAMTVSQNELLISEQWAGPVSNTGQIHRFNKPVIFKSGFED